MENLPVEIKEIVIFFCDGESLLQLRQVNRAWKILVDQEDKRRQLFKRCLRIDNIDKNATKDVIGKIFPKKSYLRTNPQLCRYIYDAVLRWKYFSNHRFEVGKFLHQFSNVIDLKISGGIVCVADKRGFYVINPKNGSLKFHDLGPVKNIELYCIYSEAINKNYEYDMADILKENAVHQFYNISRKTFVRSNDFLEKKYIKYWNEKSLQFAMNEHGPDTFIKADYYENFVMMVTRKNVVQFKDSRRTTTRKTPFDCVGARAIFLWHSKLTICAKDESLNMFVDGQTRTLMYFEFPPVTAIFYYAGWLFLGSKIGLLYGYQLRFEEMLSLELENFVIKIKICDKPIVKIDVMEKKTLSLVVASDEEIFLVHCDNQRKN